MNEVERRQSRGRGGGREVDSGTYRTKEREKGRKTIIEVREREKDKEATVKRKERGSKVKKNMEIKNRMEQKQEMKGKQ